MTAPARKPATSQGRIGHDFTAIPMGLPERLLGALSPACACLCLVVLDRSRGGRQPDRWIEWLPASEPELAGTMRMSPQGVRKLIREAESCIRDDPDRANRLGLLQVRVTARGIEMRVELDHVSRLRALREAKKLPTKAQREERRVAAMPATLNCPVGQTCPVTELFVGDDRVTNFVPADALVVATPVATMQTDAAGANGGPGASLPPGPEASEVATPVATFPDEPWRGSVAVEVCRAAAAPAPSPAEATREGRRTEPPPAPGLLELQALVERLCVGGVISKVPDDGYLGRLLRTMGGAPVSTLARAVEEKERKLAQFGTGLLLGLAADCARTYRRVGSGMAELETLRNVAYAAIPGQWGDPGYGAAMKARDEAIAKLFAHPLCGGQEKKNLARAFPGMVHELAFAEA